MARTRTPFPHVVMAGVLAMTLISGSAAASVGPEAVATRCAAPRGTPSCVSVGEPLAIAAAPDGRHVYALAQPALPAAGIRLTGFSRDRASGALRVMPTPAGCVVDRPAPGCRTFGVLADATTAVISHDGRSLYIGSYLSEARVLVALRFAPDGAVLRPAGTSCVAGFQRRPRCRTRSALEGAQELAVSADDRTVYAADSSTIEVFSRNPRTGSLRDRGCYSSYRGRCHRMRRLQSITSLTPSPDGRRLYVGIEGGLVVLRNRRRAGSTLASIPAPAGCLSIERSACARLRSFGQASPASVTVGADSRIVTLSAPGLGGTVQVFRRSRRGALRRVMCLRPDALGGCRRARGPNSALLMAPDGRTAYVLDTGGYLDALRRDPRSGSLRAPAGSCVGPLALHGCAASDGFVHFGDTSDEQTGGHPVLALSGDGRDVLVLESTGALLVAREATNAGGVRSVSCTPGNDPAACAPGIRGLADGHAGDTFTVATSPDGTNVYVGSIEDQAIAAFTRDAGTGQLVQLAGAAGCVGPAHGDGCTPPAATGPVERLAVSPDGRHVYAVIGPPPTSTAGPRRIAVLARADDGSLSPLSCCVPPDSGAEIRLSPDGETLYAFGSGRIRGFRRDPESGALTPLDGAGACVEVKYPGEAPNGCDGVRGRSGLTTLAISADGRTAYALGGGITVFARSDDGRLKQLDGPQGCVHDSPQEDCAVDPAIRTPTAIVLGDDGRRAFVVAPVTSPSGAGGVPDTRLLSYARDPSDGSLTQIRSPSACLATRGAKAGCRRAPGGVNWAFVAFGLQPSTQTLVGVDAWGNVARIRTDRGDDELGPVTTRTRCPPGGADVRPDCPAPRGQLGRPVVSPDGAFVYAGTRSAIVSVPTR